MASIKIVKNEDGFWIDFCDNDKNEALVSIDKVIRGSGSIVTKAVLNTCTQLTE